MEKNTNFFERILQIIEFYNIKSVNSFAKNYLQYDSSEKINRLKKENTNPSYEIIIDISNKFEGINIEWLLTGKGPMLKNTSTESIEPINKVNKPPEYNNVDYKEKYYELLEENRELRLKMERIEDKHNIELEKLKETLQKQVQETEKCKKELEKFRKSKNNNALLPV